MSLTDSQSAEAEFDKDDLCSAPLARTGETIALARRQYIFPAATACRPALIHLYSQRFTAFTGRLGTIWELSDRL
jgi:hypothetical protein